MTANIQSRRDYLQRRILILTAFETADMTALQALAQACAVDYSVHLYVFSPSRRLRTHEYDGRVYLQRLGAASLVGIGSIEIYHMLNARLHRMGRGWEALLPLPQQAHGFWGVLWRRWVKGIFYRCCESLSIAPRLIVATDPIIRDVALRLKERYDCPIVFLNENSVSVGSNREYLQMTPHDLLAYLSNSPVKITEIPS